MAPALKILAHALKIVCSKNSSNCPQKFLSCHPLWPVEPTHQRERVGKKFGNIRGHILRILFTHLHTQFLPLSLSVCLSAKSGRGKNIVHRLLYHLCTNSFNYCTLYSNLSAVLYYKLLGGKNQEMARAAWRIWSHILKPAPIGTKIKQFHVCTSKAPVFVY